MPTGTEGTSSGQVSREVYVRPCDPHTEYRTQRKEWREGLLDERLPKATRDFAQLIADMEDFGYCLFEDALPAEHAYKIRESLTEISENERRNKRAQTQHETTRNEDTQWIYLLINKGYIFQSILSIPEPRAIVKHVLGQHYRLSEFAATIAHPGNAQMPLHMDQWPLPAEQRYYPNPPAACNALWMISDFTAENGATRLVPRSHLRQRPIHASESTSSASVTGSSGTCLLFEGRTWHAADYNRTKYARYAIATFYCAPRLRPLVDYAQVTNVNVRCQLPRDVQQVLACPLPSPTLQSH